MSLNREAYRIVEFLKSTLYKSNTNGFALGMSGGIDSAVCAALAKRAIDEMHRGGGISLDTRTYKLDLIILPMGNHASDAAVAQEVIKSLGMDGRVVDLSETLTTFSTALMAHETGDSQGDNAHEAHLKSIGNLKARMRMSAIYYSANVNNLLVLGTDNLAETYTGYFTKHGDGAADVFPLSAFTKREVYELGRFLGLPESVLSRQPSAGLWEGQTDEGEMGVPYDFIDNRLEGMESYNRVRYGDKYYDYQRALNDLHHNTEHKRAAPHIFQRHPDEAE
jgi:NAD+ synthase